MVLMGQKKVLGMALPGSRPVRRWSTLGEWLAARGGRVSARRKPPDSLVLLASDLLAAGAIMSPVSEWRRPRRGSRSPSVTSDKER